MGLIALGMTQGDEVEVEVSGPKEEKVCARLVEMLEKKYDFPPRT
jgi:phosphotransferase system HPr-like phosphotransfer protein